MIFSTLVMSSALALATVAGYFSILGLTTIFPGVFWSIVIMGSSLEAGKLITAVWLHRNWGTARLGIKMYLTSAVVILSIITSMGIFGFLSKSHIEQESGSQGIAAKISMLDSKITSIASKKSSLESQKKTAEALKSEDYKSLARMNERLQNLDSMISQVRGQGGFSASKKLLEAQNSQSIEREQINKEKMKAQERMESYRQKIESSVFPQLEKLEEDLLLINLEKGKLNSEIKKLEAEIGPIKYIADLASDFGGPSVSPESAVRMVILILIFVFDPLAIMLVVAAAASFKEARNGEEPKDLVEFRNKFLIDLEVHLSDGKPAESFIEKYKI
jgi:hypothetical protein